MQNFTITFPLEQGMLNIADNLGGSIQINPLQAMDLMDFLLRHAETIRRFMSTDALEAKAWEAYEQERRLLKNWELVEKPDTIDLRYIGEEF